MTALPPYSHYKFSFTPFFQRAKILMEKHTNWCLLYFAGNEWAENVAECEALGENVTRPFYCRIFIPEIYLLWRTHKRGYPWYRDTQ